MKFSPLFLKLLDRIRGMSEVASLAVLQVNAAKLSTQEFHLLLGGAVRQPELLTPRLNEALER